MYAWFRWSIAPRRGRFRNRPRTRRCRMTKTEPAVGTSRTHRACRRRASSAAQCPARFRQPSTYIASRLPAGENISSLPSCVPGSVPAQLLGRQRGLRIQATRLRTRGIPHEVPFAARGSLQTDRRDGSVGEHCSGPKPSGALSMEVAHCLSSLLSSCFSRTSRACRLRSIVFLTPRSRMPAPRRPTQAS
jgi:hypothetical protein